MNNCLSARSNSNFTNHSFQRPFYFAREQYLAFAADLDQQLLKLEQRHPTNTCVPQQRIDVVDADHDFEPCTYDDFGLVEGLELDVSWM